MKELIIDLPVCNQRNLPAEWSWRGCAICSLWMLLKWNEQLQARPVGQVLPVVVSPMELLNEGLAANGYVENIGWSHRVLVELADRHGLALDYAQKFYYTPGEKEVGLALIAECLKNGKPIMASVFHELNPAKGGHMVALCGLKEFSGAVIGLDIQDPDPHWRGHNYFLTRQEFLDSWRGGLIWPK